MSKAHKGMTLNEVKERYLPHRTKEDLEAVVLPLAAIREGLEDMTASDYLKLPYCRLLVPDAPDGYAAEILEFTGCVADGATPEEAYVNLERAALAWLDVCLARGITIPAPTTYGQRHHLPTPKEG